MVAALFLRWFLHPAARYRLADRPTSRPSTAVLAVEATVGQTSGETVLRVKGEARVESAGALLSGLLASTARRRAVVTLDLSELRLLSPLALGVLVAYRRSVVRGGGWVRLAKEMQPAVKEMLARADLFDLFETTEDAEATPGHPHSSHRVAV